MSKRFISPLVAVFAIPVLLAMLLVLVYSSKGIALKSDMLALLATPSEHHQDALAAQPKLLAPQSRSLVFSFSGQDAEQAHDEFLQTLEQTPVRKVNAEQTFTDTINFYKAYQGNLFSDTYRSALESKSDFEQFYFKVLSTQNTPWLSQSIATDPSLASYSFIDTLLNQASALNMSQGRLSAHTEQGETYFLFANLPDELSFNQSMLAAQELNAALNTLSQTYKNTEIMHSGVVFHNLENSQQAKWEMNRFGLLSIVMVLCLCLFVWRAFMPIWLSFSTIATALLTGTLVLLLVRSQVHVLTFVFAITLIGVAIDYAYHTLAHISHNEQSSRNKSFRLALLLALLSTAFGYACFFTAPLTLLQDVAIFVIAGLFGAWLFVRFCITKVPLNIAFSRQSERCAQAVGKALSIFIRRRVMVALCGIVASAILLLLNPLTSNNNIASFNASSERLVEAQAFHQQVLVGESQNRFIVRGDTVEQLLRYQEKISNRVNALGGRAQSLSQYLPSKHKQTQNSRTYQQAQDDGVFSVVEQYAGKAVDIDAPRYLSQDRFFASPLAEHTSLPIKQGDSYFALITVDLDEKQLAQLISEFSDLYPVNLSQQLSDTLAHFQSSLISALLLAMALIALLFIFAFGVKQGLLGAFWLGLSALVIVAILNTLGSLSLFHTLGLVLVLALAVDYFAFYQKVGHQAHNVIAISISALSSLAVFAMLVYSKTPAISDFGCAVLVGILVVYFFAPLNLDKNNEK